MPYSPLLEIVANNEIPYSYPQFRRVEGTGHDLQHLMENREQHSSDPATDPVLANFRAEIASNLGLLARMHEQVNDTRAAISADEERVNSYDTAWRDDNTVFNPHEAYVLAAATRKEEEQLAALRAKDLQQRKARVLEKKSMLIARELLRR